MRYAFGENFNTSAIDLLWKLTSFGRVKFGLPKGHTWQRRSPLRALPFSGAAWRLRSGFPCFSWQRGGTGHPAAERGRSPPRPLQR